MKKCDGCGIKLQLDYITDEPICLEISVELKERYPIFEHRKSRKQMCSPKCAEDWLKKIRLENLGEGT